MGGAVREVRVRPVGASEGPRWNALIREQHYLGFRKFCGRRLLYVAELDGRRLALVGWHAAALHCAARERWIGWTQLQRRACRAPKRVFLYPLLSRASNHCLSSYLVRPRKRGQSTSQLQVSQIKPALAAPGSERWPVLPAAAVIAVGVILTVVVRW